MALQAFPRAAHWVIRCSDLKPALIFFKEVLGLVTIRHEENAEPCKITCNGRFNGAWSKTMVGHPQHYEDEWYCLEVTFNYGVYSYEKDNALTSFGMCVGDVEAAAAKARELGYVVEDGPSVLGPDGYRYELYPRIRPEPFLYVMCRVSNLEAAKAFYLGKLKMADVTSQLPKGLRLPEGAVAASYTDGWKVPNILYCTGEPVSWQSWSGRFAVSMPGDMITQVYSTLDKAKHVVHELGDLQEKLGRLVIAIVKDEDGYETCLVSSEFFDKATRAETNWKEPDWDHRRAFLDERSKTSDKGKSS